MQATDVPAAAGSGRFSWQLYGADGRLLRQIELTAAATTRLRIDAPPGLYYWTLTGQQGARQRGRLVVR